MHGLQIYHSTSNPVSYATVSMSTVEVIAEICLRVIHDERESNFILVLALTIKVCFNDSDDMAMLGFLDHTRLVRKSCLLPDQPCSFILLTDWGSAEDCFSGKRSQLVAFSHNPVHTAI